LFSVFIPISHGRFLLLFPHIQTKTLKQTVSLRRPVSRYLLSCDLKLFLVFCLYLFILFIETVQNCSTFVHLFPHDRATRVTIFVCSASCSRSFCAGSQGAGVHITNQVNLKSFKNNTEVAMKLTSSVDSENEFYADLNAFQVFIYFIEYLCWSQCYQGILLERAGGRMIMYSPLTPVARVQLLDVAQLEHDTATIR